MIEHTPKFRKWVNRLAIISLSIGMMTMILIFFYLSQQNKSNQTSCEEWMTSTIEPLSFEAEITEKKIEDERKCLGTIELSIDKPSFLEICECPDEKNFVGWVEKGDSIFKKSGERTLYVKKNKESLRGFEYPCCE